MDYRVIRPDFARWRSLCIAAAIAAAASSSLAIFTLSSLRAEYRAHNAAARASSALRAAAEGRETALARGKSFLPHTEALPPRAETANKFYATLLEAISDSGLSEVNLSASDARSGESAFVLSGRAEYMQLRQFIFSLRELPYLARLSKLSMNGASNGEVEFSAEVAAAAANAE